MSRNMFGFGRNEPEAIKEMILSTEAKKGPGAEQPHPLDKVEPGEILPTLPNGDTVRA